MSLHVHLSLLARLLWLSLGLVPPEAKQVNLWIISVFQNRQDIYLFTQQFYVRLWGTCYKMRLVLPRHVNQLNAPSETFPTRHELNSSGHTRSSFKSLCLPAALRKQLVIFYSFLLVNNFHEKSHRAPLLSKNY